MDSQGNSQLVGRAMSGDVAAIKLLLLNSWDPLVALLAPHIPTDLRPMIGVEDVIQETNLYVLKHFSKFRGETPAGFYAWLKKIGWNKLRDAIRRERGRGKKPRPGRHRDEASMAGLAENLSFRGASPTRAAARRELQKKLQIALDDLPTDYAKVLVLRYFDELAVKEIADLMNRTSNAISALLRRARGELKARMGTESDFFSNR